MIEAQAAFITEVQRACRKVKQTRHPQDLKTAADLMNSAEFTYLPDPVQEDLHFAYAEALMATTGAFS